MKEKGVGQHYIRRILMMVLTGVMLLLSVGGMTAGAAEGEPVSGDGTVTRAQWLHDLVVLFDMTVEEDNNLPENFFRDVPSDHEYYRDMLVAVEYGVVDVPAGGSVQPDAAVDRMFAAHTLNYCMGFKLEEAEYTFSDVDAVKNPAAPEDTQYADDAQIAVNRGWLELISGAFCPDAAITQAEAEAMYADVRAILPTTEIDVNHENVYQYADGVVEIPDGTEVYVDENNTVTVWQCPVTVNAGDVFVIYISGIPQIYEAVTVEGDETELVITTQETDAAAAIADMDVELIAEADLSLATAVDGATITYIEGGTAAAQFEDGVMYRDARIAQKKDIEAIRYDKKIEIAPGVKVSVGCIMTNMQLEYKAKLIGEEAYVRCHGDAIVTGSVSADAVEALGGSAKIQVGKFGIDGICKVDVYVVVAADGKLTATYESEFNVGMQHSKDTGFRLIKEFKKKKFELVAQIEMKLGVRMDGYLGTPIVYGNFWAEFGAKAEYVAHAWGDGEKPAMCESFRGWLYAELSVNLTCNWGVKKDYFNRQRVIFDFKNSPVKLAYHWEDGVRTDGCTREGADEDEWFLYNYNSRYGNPGDGYYWDAGGSYVPVFTYTLAENEYKKQVATITGYTGSAYTLAIPSEIDGYPVVAIGDGAFDKRADLHIVTIPDSVLKIGDRAFEACTSLQQVDMGNGVTEIGRFAFNSCSNLMAVDLSDAVTKINEDAFSKCTSLQNIMIPKSLTEISNWGNGGGNSRNVQT